MTTPTRRTSTPAEGAVSVHTLAGQGRIGLMGLLAIQAILGYEWLVSGAAKIFGDFVPDFADQLPEFSQNAPDWFRRGLDALVVPAPTLWAISIELAEFLIGLTLIVAAALWAWWFDWLPQKAHLAVVAVTGVAAIFAVLLAVSLHILNGGTHPWLLPRDAFDEGVDLDSLLPALQLVLFVVSLRILLGMRRHPPSLLPADSVTPEFIRPEIRERP